MSKSISFPRIPECHTQLGWEVQTWGIRPDQDALETLAKGIWSVAEQTGQRPLVILSTAGPLMGVRLALEEFRPSSPLPQIAFLPEVMSFSDWIARAPLAWTFPKSQTPLDRWLAVFAALKKHPKLKAWFKAETEAGAWGLAQAIIAACDALSNSLLPHLPLILDGEAGEDWLMQMQHLLDKAIEEAYPKLARTVVDREAEVLLLFWRYLSGSGDPVFRKHLAMASHLRANATRPLIWVQTAEPLPSEHQFMQGFLNQYARHAPVVNATLDWMTVGLWQEALPEFDADPEERKAQCLRNSQAAFQGQWRLLSANRFEELAWTAAKAVEERLIAGKSNIALVAQDRLVARRARALLARLGPNLAIRDETGWKLSTTRAAAALHSWLELIRAPKDGPSATDLLEFLQNPFFNVATFLEANAQDCQSVVAELEDRLIASQAQSGWETFHLALEGIKYGDRYRFAPASPLVFQLLQSIRGRLNRWRANTVSLASAFTQLHDDLVALGMVSALQQDSAGIQLLESIKVLDVQVASDTAQPAALRLVEWLSLLKTVIEESTYQEEGVVAQARLSILPLSSTRMRTFDAVIVVGADEQHLPAFSEPPLFFSETLSCLLQGPTIAAEYRQQARDLSQLLVTCPEVDLLWQSRSSGGEPIRPSAWIQRLQMALPEWQVNDNSLGKALRSGHAKPASVSSATPSEDLPLPLSMSPSAYRTLRDCPYRYYVRSLLGLSKHKGLDEGVDASLAGRVIHSVLRSFFYTLKTEDQIKSVAIPLGSAERCDWMERHLSEASEQVFAPYIDGDARVLGILRDWQKQIPSFVKWQMAREERGWRYCDGEVKVSFDLPFMDHDGEQRTMLIEGYADRFDVHVSNTNSAAVLDYKYQSLYKVRHRAQHLLDDPQLLIYASAANRSDAIMGKQGRQISEAEWVALKLESKDRNASAARSVEVEDLAQQSSQFTQQITNDIELLWSRKALHAFAPDSVCQYCEARGICRKGMW